MRLRDWQQRFQQAVLQPALEDAVLLAALQEGSIAAAAQLGIYQNAYGARLNEALLSNYPALHLLLGDRDFGKLCDDYLRQHPPTQASIRWFGDAMAAFLEQTAPYSAVPTIAELARFEWALRHTVDAADCERVTAQALKDIALQRWGELHFTLHPSVTILDLQWNAPQVWRALTDGEDAPAPQPGAKHWIVHRQPDMVSGWRSVGDVEQAALQCLVDGGNFADVCAAIAAGLPDPQDGAATAAGLLRTWVEQGLLALRDVERYEEA